MSASVFHIAIEDDWEASAGIGAYEAATREVVYEPGGYIRAVAASGVQHVLDTRYRDLTLPLLLVALDPDALERAGIPVERAEEPAVRIRGALPRGDDAAVIATTLLTRDGDRWLAPAGLA